MVLNSLVFPYLFIFLLLLANCSVSSGGGNSNSGAPAPGGTLKQVTPYVILEQISGRFHPDVFSDSISTMGAEQMGLPLKP